MTNQEQKPNYKAFIPIGIVFMGAGVTFLTTINPGVGAAMIAVGIVFLVIGVRKSRQEN